MFEKASRMKLRFDTAVGKLMVEDLWDLKDEDLDNIYRDLMGQKKVGEEVTLLTPPRKETDTLNLSIEIVTHIVKTKLDEETRKKDRAARLLQKRKLLEIIAAKENEALAGRTLDDLRKEVEALED